MASSAQDHPEFPIESDRLARTIEAIKRELKEPAIAAATPWTEAVLRRTRMKQLDQLRDAMREPYFARIDFESPDLDRGSFYIGYTAVLDTVAPVQSWASPIAKLYYEAPPGPAAYRNAADEHVAGDMLLKRHFLIQRSELRGIRDAFDLRGGRAGQPGTVAEKGVSGESSYLHDVLANRTGANLTDITPTIQREQYALISAPPEGVLVIQGVAGSGKTSIGLQRLAYLLHPDTATNIDGRDCLVLGPNTAFMDHIRQVLPGLHESDVRQLALPQWTLKELGIEDASTTDKVLAGLLALKPSDRTPEVLVKAARARNSPAMKRLLDALADRVRKRTSEAGAKDISLGPIGSFRIRLTIDGQFVESARERSAAVPPAERRKTLLEDHLLPMAERLYQQELQRTERDHAKLASSAAEDANAIRQRTAWLRQHARPDHLQQLAALRNAPPSTVDDLPPRIDSGLAALDELAQKLDRESEMHQVRARDAAFQRTDGETSRDLRKELRQALAGVVPSLVQQHDTVRVYLDLLKDNRLLEELASQAGIEPAHLRGVQFSSTTRALDLSDLAALHYLHVKLNGPSARFDHIVLDEAQDVSPLMFEVLQEYARGGSMTLLGDANQGLSFFRAIPSWDQLQSIFQLDLRREVITRSYRSTLEITRFANSVLASISSRSTVLADPFPRSGATPVVQPAATPEEQALAAAQFIDERITEGSGQVAVLCRNLTLARQNFRLLKGLLDCPLALGLASNQQDEGCVVLPINEAQGLEFDTVVMMDVDRYTYGATEMDSRLLYVGVSRALHSLAVFGVGPMAAQVVADPKPSTS